MCSLCVVLILNAFVCHNAYAQNVRIFLYHIDCAKSENWVYQKCIFSCVISMFDFISFKGAAKSDNVAIDI